MFRRYDINLNIYSYIYILVGGIPTHLKNMDVSWDDYSFPIYGKS